MFKTAIGVLLAQQAVMFDVIGTGQLPPGEDIVDGEKGQHDPAEGKNQCALQDETDGIRLQRFIFIMPSGFVQTCQTLTLNLPAALPATGNLT